MKWCLTTLIGIALIPAIWGTAATLFDLLVEMQTEAHSQQLLLAFLAGAVGWILIFLFLGRPVRLYILGHELTHLLAAWASGIRGGELEVNAEGGSVSVERSTFWVSIAPYFIPLYSLLVLIGVGIARIWIPGAGSGIWFPVLLGVTWSFHLTFTLVALGQPQSDVRPYGWPGCFLIILLINLLLLTGVAAGAHSGPPLETGRSFLKRQSAAYGWVTAQVFEEKLQ